VSCLAANRTVGGYRVHIENTPGGGGQSVCAYLDGLRVGVWVRGGNAPSAVSVFAHDIRVLGPDPARWTTRPVG